MDAQHHLTRLNGANKANEKSSCVIQRQVEVDDIIGRDAI